MARLKITQSMCFHPDPALRKLAEKVTRAYPEYFDHIELDEVYFCTEITGKDSGANAVCHRIAPLVRGLLLQGELDYQWIIAFFSSETEGKSQEWLNLLMFHELLHIGVDGKMVDHDIEEFTSVLDLGGISWQADRKLPNILRRKLKLIA